MKEAAAMLNGGGFEMVCFSAYQAQADWARLLIRVVTGLACQLVFCLPELPTNSRKSG